MPAPKFIQRVARLPEVFAVLSEYPDGLSLGDLANRFDTDSETMAQDLTCFTDLESWGWTFNVYRLSVIELAQPDGETDRPSESTIVRVSEGGSAGLGVEHLSPGELALIYTAGVALLEANPADEDLDDALTVIAETMSGQPVAQPHVGDWNAFVGPLQTAVAEHRRVRLVYSRAWRAGVFERTVEPLKLIQTRRGWEVDAGPVGDEGNLRTYLLTNIREADLLDETFEPPSQVESRLARQRQTTTVRMELAQDARWAADMFAEQVDVVRGDEETFEADLELLPPAGERVGLIMLASGPDTRLIDRGDLLPQAMDVARELLRHHSEDA